MGGHHFTAALAIGPACTKLNDFYMLFGAPQDKINTDFCYRGTTAINNPIPHVNTTVPTPTPGNAVRVLYV
jgi:hypothetical protein